MREFNCKSCNKIWFVNEDMADEIVGCPFCMRELPKVRTITVNSFEDAVLKVIVDYGVEIISDRRKFLSYLTDVAFDFRKEIKILSNACDAKIFSQFYEISLYELDDAQNKIKQIQQHLVDEEGIAEGWANRICECFLCAIREDYVPEKQYISTKKQATLKKIELTSGAKTECEKTIAINIYELAKDLNMTSNELFELLSENSSTENFVHSGILNADEVSLILDTLTQRYQIKNLDDYLSGKAKIKADLSSCLKAPKAPTNSKIISNTIAPFKCSKVTTIYENEISKIVSQPNFPNWFNKKKSKHVSIYELIIPNRVQSIAEGQYQNNKSFDWLIIGTGLKKIPKRAFQNISAEFIYLSDGVKEIGEYAFSDSNIKCVIIANHTDITISDTAFIRSNNIKLVFEHEWFSDIVKFCDSNKIAHAGFGPMEAYFAEYAKIKLKEKEIK